jgi:cytidine deaminase
MDYLDQMNNKKKLAVNDQKDSIPFSYEGVDPLTPSGSPEIVIGIVGPIGVDRQRVTNTIKAELKEYSYKSIKIKLSTLMQSLSEIKLQTEFEDEFERINYLMNEGNNLRAKSEMGDALALLAILKIQEERERLNIEDNKQPNAAREKTAFILDSIKHPDEISTLRATYGQGFVLISVHDRRANRVENIAKRISDSRKDPQGSMKARPDAETLIYRDEKEHERFGQNVQSCFPKADYFVDLNSNSKSLVVQLDRFFQIYFNNPFITPTKDEWGMFHAESASWRSADLARQVGSSICGDEGQVLALGCNEVPKANGGLYWEGDKPDGRDFQFEYDQGAELKHLMLAEVFNRLKESGEFSEETNDKFKKLIENSISGKDDPILNGLQALNVIEYGRTVHAEMASLMDAVSRGVSVRSSTMYVNTFPCHICARHIISSGLKRVVYIEPYPKSFTKKLFSDSISETPNNKKVLFEPFIGVAPRLYQSAFKLITKRKSKEGRIVDWKKGTANTRLKRFVTSYMAIENQIASSLIPKMIEKLKGK